MGTSKKGKPEIDKEYLFNLIMPSPTLPPQGEGASQPAAGSPSPQSRPAPLAQEKLDSLGRAGAQLHPAKNLVLVNLAELLVIDRLDAVFEKFRCCRCDKCKRDVAALALNALPPQYVVAEPEQIPALLEQCQTKEVSAALVRAVLQVKNNPRH